ncbi:hypothetical protein JCM8547_006913 [Rhodosporidiobolus lusitaniae]
MSLAPAAPLARAIDHARHSLEGQKDRMTDELQTAEELVREARRTEEEADREGEELPEELDTTEAEEVLDNEYRPLMEDDADSDHDAEQGSRGKRRSKGKKAKVRKLEVWLAYFIFFILGAAILLGWNQIIVATSYFAARLEGSRFESVFASAVSLTFTTGNLVFLAHANLTQGSANLSRRISWSILIMTFNLGLFIITTRIGEIPAGLFLTFLMASAVLLSASASYLQNAVVALAASFGPSYLAHIVSGQGAIGFAVAMVQFVAALGAAKSARKNPSPSDLLIQSDFASPEALLTTMVSPPAAIRNSAFSFFLAVGIFGGVSWLAYFVLVHLPLYRLVIRAEFTDENASTKSATPPVAEMKVVERKVRHLGVAMFIVFATTLSVFPSITATILSVKTGKPDASLLQQPELFVPLGFAVFAGGDWLGRVLPQWEKLAWANWKVLMGGSVARLVFIPLFLFCNQTTGEGGHVLIRSDLLYFLIMFLFAISNGYLSTLIMLASVAEPSLNDHEIDVAATCLAFYLTLGLAGGSFLRLHMTALRRTSHFAQLAPPFLFVCCRHGTLSRPALGPPLPASPFNALDGMPRDDDSSSSSSSSDSSSRRHRRRGRRDSTDSSSSSSSWGSNSESDDGKQRWAEPPPTSPFSGLSCVVLAVCLAAAVGFAVFLANKSSGSSGSTSGGSSDESSSKSSAGGTGSTTKATATVTGSGAPAATTVPADFLESLASKYSMTSASIPSLSMPSTAIPSATAAQQYIESSWNHVKGSSEYISFVEDPLDEGGEMVLQVEYPKGSIGEGVANMQLGVFADGKNRAMVSYEVGFNDGFDFVLGGKLPGSYGGDPNSGCTGGSNSENCFSLRLMWRTDGAGELYAYVPRYDGQCDDSTGAYCHDDYGISYDRGSFTLQAGSYNTLTEVAIINSDVNTANGYLAVYAGETLAFEVSDVVLRINETVLFTAFAISTFFGGSTDEYASSADAFSYFRNMRFFDGDDTSSETGSTVTATIESSLNRM